MRDVFGEMWMVFSRSTKTQLAIVCGMLSFGFLRLMGEVLVGGIEFHGSLAPLTEVIKHKLIHRYDKAAWGALASFACLAVWAYRKDQLRLLDA